MKRTIAAILISVPMVVLLWLAVSINNLLLNNALIADDYVMPVCVLAMLLIVVGLNPLLGAISARWRLDRAQLALIFSIALIGASLTSSGLLRHSLHPLAWTTYHANQSPVLADAYEKMSPPPSLFPDRLGYEQELPVVGPFIDELPESEPIPWKAWIKPLLSWSGFIMPWFLMMIATAVIFYAYWRDTERLPMPLLKVQQSLITLPDGDGYIPVIFRNRLFWTAFGIVFFLHALGQGARNWPGAIPSFPLRWNLSACFTELPWRSLPGSMKSGMIYFTFLGVAFFIPKRISFSLWFGQIAYAIYIMLRVTYFPPMNYMGVTSFRAGAFMTFPLVVLWLARRHLLYVAGTVIRRPKTPDDRAYRVAAWSLIAGVLGMFIWLLWVDVPPVWAAGLTAAGFLSALALMRVFAETGLPLFFPAGGEIHAFIQMIPTAWRTLAGMYFSGILSAWYGSGQRVCIGAVAAQALGMNRDHKPKQHVRLGALFMVILFASLIGAGMFSLRIAYRNSMTVSGGRIANWGSGQFGLAERQLVDTVRGKPSEGMGERLPGVLIGSGVTAALYGLWQLSPYWPIHPVAIICIGSFSVHQATPSIFLAWLVKVMVLRYGGSRLHKRVEPIFLGMIFGEVLALISWCLLGGFRALSGLPFHAVNILPP